MISTRTVLEEVANERDRQDELFPGQWGALNSGAALAILVEEVGEVAKELCEGDPTGNLRTELIQVAAVAVAWAEQL